MLGCSWGPQGPEGEERLLSPRRDAPWDIGHPHPEGTEASPLLFTGAFRSLGLIGHSSGFSLRSPGWEAAIWHRPDASQLTAVLWECPNGIGHGCGGPLEQLYLGNAHPGPAREPFSGAGPGGSLFALQGLDPVSPASAQGPGLLECLGTSLWELRASLSSLMAAIPLGLGLGKLGLVPREWLPLTLGCSVGQELPLPLLAVDCPSSVLDT